MPRIKGTSLFYHFGARFGALGALAYQLEISKCFTKLGEIRNWISSMIPPRV
jgi:hypothetical protein